MFNANAMIHIKEHKTLPLNCHSLDIPDQYDKYLAMYWIQYVKTIPPKELMIDVNVSDYNGYTMAMYWIQYVKSDVPVSTS